MDISFILDRLAIGEGIWTADRMARLAMLGFTHIVDVQQEFDDTELARAQGLEVLWNPTDDDFQPKHPDFFHRSVSFALKALQEEEYHQVYVHCAAGVHRAPLTGAAILCGLGYSVEEALDLIRARRASADFPLVYVESLRRFVQQWEQTQASQP